MSGSQAKDINAKPANTATTPAAENDIQVEGTAAPQKKIVDINQPQVCRNKGCGKTFKEKDNHENACDYHPGPAVFHDRMKGVCIYYIINFNEFLT